MTTVGTSTSGDGITMAQLSSCSITYFLMIIVGAAGGWTAVQFNRLAPPHAVMAALMQRGIVRRRPPASPPSLGSPQADEYGDQARRDLPSLARWCDGMQQGTLRARSAIGGRGHTGVDLARLDFDSLEWVQADVAEQRAEWHREGGCLGPPSCPAVRQQ
jgi:hypothetical protein